MRLLVFALLSELREAPRPHLLLASSCGLALHLAIGAQAPAFVLCGGSPLDRSIVALYFSPTLAGDTVLFLSASWATMLLVMIAPLLYAPLRCIWRGSLPRMRIFSVSAFLAGQFATWMCAGAMLVPVAITLRVQLGVLALPCAALAATLWQVCSTKRACLNGAHRLPTLRAFGRGALTDAFAFGARSAAFCTGSCWAIMLVALLAGAQPAAMVVATAFMFGERTWMRAAGYRPSISERLIATVKISTAGLAPSAARSSRRVRSA